MLATTSQVRHGRVDHCSVTSAQRGKPSARTQAIGRSRGAPNTKFHAKVNALGQRRSFSARLGERMTWKALMCWCTTRRTGRASPARELTTPRPPVIQPRSDARNGTAGTGTSRSNSSVPIWTGNLPVHPQPTRPLRGCTAAVTTKDCVIGIGLPCNHCDVNRSAFARLLRSPSALETVSAESLGTAIAHQSA